MPNMVLYFTTTKSHKVKNLNNNNNHCTSKKKQHATRVMYLAIYIIPIT